MGRSAVLSIKILTDATAAQKGMGQAEKSVGKFQGGLEKAAVPAGIAIAAVGAFAVAAGKAASDVQQSMGAVDSVFGDSAGQIKAWSDQSATTVGLAKGQYGELAAVLGAQLKNMGVPMDQIAGKTNELITMGADLAATYGGTTADAVAALGSALRGETDPIEKYGISIKQADIAARQAKDGTKGLEGEAGKAAKTQALLALATEQAGGAMGQFARESDSAAGSQQIATAQWEDAKAALGESLLPVMSALAGILAKVAGFVKENSTAVGIAVGVIGALAAAILVANAAISIYTTVTTLAGIASGIAWLAALGPILLVIAAVLAVVGVIVLLWKKCEWFRNAVTAIWRAIRTAFVVSVNAIRAAWNSTVNAIRSAWAAVTNWIRAAVAAVKAQFVSQFNAVRSVVGTVASAVRRAWDAVFGALRRAVSSVGEFLARPFYVIRDAVNVVVDAIRNLISWFGRIKVPKISLPSIPGFNSTQSVVTTAAPVAVGALAATPTARAATTSTGGLVININGAIDPEATARQVRRILSAHDRRMGLSAGLRAGTV